MGKLPLLALSIASHIKILQPFVEKFDELFFKFTRKGKVCYISGDFNLDLLQFQNNSITVVIRL